MPDGAEKPIGYVSPTLTKSEQNGSQLEEGPIIMVAECADETPELWQTH